MPTRDDFTSPNEVIVHVTGPVDSFGRRSFTAYWPTDQEWVPGGVRSQLFFASLADFTARAVNRDQEVRISEVA